MKLAGAFILAAAACASASASDDWFDQLADRLTFSAWGDTLRTRLSGLLSVEGYQLEQPAPGLLFTDGHTLFNPRLALYLDGQLGARLSGFAQARIDRGFDPGNRPPRGRLDEYALNFIPWVDGRCNLRAGQFATVIGNWVARHEAWGNPFINAPLPYENLTSIIDSAAPASPEEFTAAEAGEKYEHNPIIWGPSYATGVSLWGRRGRFDYAVETKNSGPASRPESWSIRRSGFGRPAYAARVGFRPDLRWNLGLSASDSVYFQPAAAASLPAGTSRHDYRERLLAHDIGFAWHYLQVWAEIFHARFDVPRIGAVRTIAGYIETKYKFTPQVFGALRWNRQGFSSIKHNQGDRMPWGHDLWRIDAAAGYRFTSHTELKLQASVQEEATRPDAQVLYATQFNVRF